MPPKPLDGHDLLAQLRKLASARRTNPYQIAKATGVPLHSVQILLSAVANPTLGNFESIVQGFGYEITLVRKGEPSIEPGTGRGHGVVAGRKRKGG
jgi:DNA-binding phage protein